jgi:hypoxanthine phosphoribosyltransferase
MKVELPDNCELVFDNNAISNALDRLADKLNQQLVNDNPVVLCVMQGGLVFSGHIIPKLKCMLEIDYIHATRYNNLTTGGEINWISYPVTSLKNRTVLILDDILDEGITLRAIVDYCVAQGAEKVVSAVLLKKDHDRCAQHDSLEVNLSGNIALTVGDDYVFGFGMDYEGKYRQLDSIFALSSE